MTADPTDNRQRAAEALGFRELEMAERHARDDVDHIAAALDAAEERGRTAVVAKAEALCDAADDQPDGYECRFIAVDVIRAALAGENR